MDKSSERRVVVWFLVIVICPCCYPVQKASSGVSSQQPGMTGLPQCIDMPLLVDSTDQLGMDSEDLVPTLTVCYFSSSMLWTCCL